MQHATKRPNESVIFHDPKKTKTQVHEKYPLNNTLYKEFTIPTYPEITKPWYNLVAEKPWIGLFINYVFECLKDSNLKCFPNNISKFFDNFTDLYSSRIIFVVNGTFNDFKLNRLVESLRFPEDKSDSISTFNFWKKNGIGFFDQDWFLVKRQNNPEYIRNPFCHQLSYEVLLIFQKMGIPIYTLSSNSNHITNVGRSSTALKIIDLKTNNKYVTNRTDFWYTIGQHYKHGIDLYNEYCTFT